eukprot:jgi/Tetstr1/466050/TSEL_010637.t1
MQWSEVETFAEAAVDAIVLTAVERVLGVFFDPSTYGTDTNPVVTDFLAELLHDPDPMLAEALSLPTFNVVTGSYDPRSLKSTLLEFKTMRYGVKYTAVPRATDVDRFKRSWLIGDMKRGLGKRDAAWHNTEPGQKRPLRNILDVLENTGMVFGTVDGGDSSAIPLPKLHGTSVDHPRTDVHVWPGL